MDEHQHVVNYLGDLKDGRMHGTGTFWFNTGTRYEGQFKDGAFHGKGTLFFAHGGQYEAEWKNGIEQSGQLFFGDGLKYEPEEWPYCLPDENRRFYQEHLRGLNPADRSMMAAKSNPYSGRPVHSIPDDCYDVGDGIYNPVTRIVYRYDEDDPLQEFLRSATDDEHEWIIASCRKGWDEFVGFTKALP